MPPPDAVVALVGELHDVEAEDLRDRVLQAVDEKSRPRVVVDWSRLSITDAPSLGVLLAIVEELEASGHRVVMVGPSEEAAASREPQDRREPQDQGVRPPAGRTVRHGELASSGPRLPPDLASELIRELFSIGLELTSAQSLVGPGDARRRLDWAIGDLDALIRQLRKAVFRSGPASG